MSFVVLNYQVVEWVDILANPVFKNPGIYFWNLIEISIKKDIFYFSANNTMFH